jgi:hypothetical protein
VAVITGLFALYFFVKRFIPYDSKPQGENWKKLDYCILGLIIILLGVVIINGLWNVVSVWDALTLYDFRALRIVETGSISQAATIQGDYFYSYPLFTSLAHVSLYLLGLKSPMIFYSLLFASFISVFYGLLRRSTSRTLSLFATLLLVIAPHLFWHAQIAYTNLPYTIYLGLGAIYIIEYYRTGKRTDALLGALLTGLSIWVRSVEPFWMVNILVLLGVTLYKRRYLDSILSLFIFIPLERVWKTYIAVARGMVAENPIGQVTNAVSSIVSSNPSSISTVPLIEIITYFLSYAVRPLSPVLILFFVGIAYKLSTRKKEWVGEIMLIGYYTIAFYGTYVFSYSQPYWRDIPGSLERMMMFISPIIIFIFAQVFTQLISTNLPHIKYNKNIL